MVSVVLQYALQAAYPPLQVNKFLGKEEPSHGNWKKVGPWKKAEEEDTDLVPGKKCSKCEELVMVGDVNCTSTNHGSCEPKGR